MLNILEIPRTVIRIEKSRFLSETNYIFRVMIKDL